METYGYNYNTELTGIGREVRIADDYMSYYYALADGDTLDSALTIFADGYDFNLDPDGDIVSVLLRAEQYQDGELIAHVERAINSTNS
jgi:hypothetical protein